MINWQEISLENLAAFVAEELRKKGIDTVLVGGACVTIYSQNRYQSYDLDFATYEDMKQVKEEMTKLGFHLKGRHFVHNDCPWVVEFVAPPVAVDNHPIREFEELKLKLGTIVMLRPEDSVKDRLASYFYWNDRQGLEQAIEICLHRQVNLKEVQSWAVHENHFAEFKEFQERLKQRQKK